MIEAAGWWLPQGDSYFPKFLAGTPRKSNGFQREHLLAAFDHVQAWNVAVDVGAHVGFWTRDMAQRFAMVRAFEAAADTFACLQRNMAEFQHVHVTHAAVGQCVSAGRIVEDPTRIGNTGSRYVEPWIGGDLMIMTIDGLGLPACDLLKIDVEGFEWQVLQGAVDTILSNRPVVIMECDKRFAMDRYGVPDTAAEKFLLGLGYEEVAHMRPDKVFVHRA